MRLHATSGVIRPALPVAILAAMLITVAGCERHDDSAVTQTPRNVTAQLHSVGYEDVAETYTTSGTFISDERVEIASRISGFIRELSVREGEVVKKGQVIVTIDPTEVQTNIKEAEARLTQAQRKAAEAKAEYERHKNLFEQKLVAEQLFRKVELQHQLAQEDLRVAQGALEQARALLEYAKIKSPVTGVVVEKFKQNGDLTTPGANILAVEDPTRIVLRTFINEAYVQYVKQGDAVSIRLDNLQSPLQGMVTHVVPSADPSTHTYMVKIALEDLARVRVGMFARVDFNMGQKQVITVPVSAIVLHADLPGVYLVDDQDLAHFRMVRTGRHFNDSVEIISGLESGDRIVTVPDDSVKTGDRITAE
jgi:RND family efflux transporter MFP subunit